MTYCLRRAPHLSRAQFQDYWLNSHGPLVRSHAPALNILRYVQLHTADHPVNEAMQKSRGASAPFDGIAEIWFDSVEAMTGAGQGEAYKVAMRALREDEARFIDQAQSPAWFGAEHAVVEGRPAPRQSAGRKAAATKRRNVAGKKAAVTKRRKAAARKAVSTKRRRAGRR